MRRGSGGREHDYIANGYYAATAADERKCPAMEANQLLNITDVTQAGRSRNGRQVGPRLSRGASGRSRRKSKATAARPRIVRCEVVTLYHGGVYDLYKYRRYQDLRLVFAPEEGIAFFGGDPDNFTFPRYDWMSLRAHLRQRQAAAQPSNYLKFANGESRTAISTSSAAIPAAPSATIPWRSCEYQRDIAQPFMLNIYSRTARRAERVQHKGPERSARRRIPCCSAWRIR